MALDGTYSIFRGLFLQRATWMRWLPIRPLRLSLHVGIPAKDRGVEKNQAQSKTQGPGSPFLVLPALGPAVVGPRCSWYQSRTGQSPLWKQHLRIYSNLYVPVQYGLSSTRRARRVVSLERAFILAAISRLCRALLIIL